MKPRNRAFRLAVISGTSLLLADPTFAQATQPATPSTPQNLSPVIQSHDLSVQISEYIRCIFQDRDGNLWFGTNNEGVCRYDGKSLVFFGIKDGFAGHAARAIVQTSDGAMWFTTENGVSRYHQGQFTTYSTAEGLSSNDTWSMMLDSAGTLWIGTREGVCRYVGAGDAKAKKVEKPFAAFALPRVKVETQEVRFDPRLVWSMFEDREGSIWFGTDGEGARKYDGTSFTTYTAKDGLGGNQVRCIRGDRKGHIWLSGDNAGATCFDGKTFRNFTANDGLGNNRVFLILEDKAGILWFSTLGDGVTRYDGTTFTVYRQLGNLTKTHVQSIFQDKDGTLWFGCSGGLFRFDSTSFINVTKNGQWR